MCTYMILMNGGQKRVKRGKAFELFVKHILLGVGFHEVGSDGLYVFDGASGQMIQGLGEAHNADVLLEPPVQTPFYAQTRLLVECKDYKKRVGLDIVRSALGLREDVNHFDIVDANELMSRRSQRRKGGVCYSRYLYQVAIASWNGFTYQAQKFAATHRIPLIEFDKLPFWGQLRRILNVEALDDCCLEQEVDIDETSVIELAKEVGSCMALAITNLGQVLFLYHRGNEMIDFAEYPYSIYWEDAEHPWTLRYGEHEYSFQLPQHLLECWLNESVNELSMKKEAIGCKISYLSNMVVYYRHCDSPTIKMLSINQGELDEARRRLENNR